MAFEKLGTDPTKYTKQPGSHADGRGLYLVVNGATKLDDIAHLRDELPDEVTLNHMEDHALLALQGPKAAAVHSQAAAVEHWQSRSRPRSSTRSR